VRSARWHMNQQILCARCPTIIAEWDYQDGRLVIKIVQTLTRWSRRLQAGMTVFYLAPTRLKRMRDGRRADHRMNIGSASYHMIDFEALPIGVECWRCKGRTVSVIAMSDSLTPTA